MNIKHCPKCEQDLPLSNFSKHSKRKDGLQSYCKVCKKIIDASHYQRNKDAQIARNKKNAIKYKTLIDNYKIKCGCKYCDEKEPCCLQFHHPDPTIKDGTVSQLKYINQEKTWKEIKKCEVVCANCHLKIHSGIL